MRSRYAVQIIRGTIGQPDGSRLAVAAEPGVTLLDERDGPEAHFLLSF
jgi:hypothetical protein